MAAGSAGGGKKGGKGRARTVSKRAASKTHRQAFIPVGMG